MSTHSGGGSVRHLANAGEWRAVCTSPDYCKVGSSVIGFDSFAVLSNVASASPNVTAQRKAVYRVGDLVKGVQADAGKHVVSGTSLGSGYVKFLDGQNNVKVNGIPVARHDSRCLVNCNESGSGGAPAKLVTAKKGSAASPAAGGTRPADTKRAEQPANTPQTQMATMKAAANGFWERYASGQAGAQPGAPLADSANLMGPPYALTNAAYLSGDAAAMASAQSATGPDLPGDDADAAETPLTAATRLDAAATAAKAGKKHEDAAKIEAERDSHLQEAGRMASAASNDQSGVHVGPA